MPNLKPPAEALSIQRPETSLRTDRELQQHNSRHKVAERRRIVRKLRQSLAASELVLHFQPIVSLTTGLTRGAESVLRLPHSRRGFIPVGHFLPLAEQSDVIIDIGAWMLHAACGEAIKFPKNFSVSLALSLRHFQSGQLVRHLLEALNGSGLAPERLELLITEATLLDENDDTNFALKAAQSLGVRLALNHFGASYASLAPLRRLPFANLRLDRSITQNLNGDPASAAILHAAVETGHALGCSVLADGVESTMQYEMLRQARADEGQGLFFGSAVQSIEFSDMFGLRQEQA